MNAAIDGSQYDNIEIIKTYFVNTYETVNDKIASIWNDIPSINIFNSCMNVNDDELAIIENIVETIPSDVNDVSDNNNDININNNINGISVKNINDIEVAVCLSRQNGHLVIIKLLIKHKHDDKSIMFDLFSKSKIHILARRNIEKILQTWFILHNDGYIAKNILFKDLEKYYSFSGNKHSAEWFKNNLEWVKFSPFGNIMVPRGIKKYQY